MTAMHEASNKLGHLLWAVAGVERLCSSTALKKRIGMVKLIELSEPASKGGCSALEHFPAV
jgi:hypothetical protein